MDKYRTLLLYNLEVILGDKYNHAVLNQYSDEMLEFLIRENMPEFKKAQQELAGN